MKAGLAGLHPKDPDPGSAQIKLPGEEEPRAFSKCHRADLLEAIQALKSHSDDKEAVTPEEAELLERLHKALGEHSPIALTSRQGREGTLVVFTLALKEQELDSLLELLLQVLRGSEAAKKSAKIMQQFSEEFAKGMEEWGKSLKAQGKDAKLPP